ncbi:MAG: hypothetical protein M5U05_18030 [Anaerolineales bacterium]|nr:hypothetical protein [Anaerolineales bacterium]
MNELTAVVKAVENLGAGWQVQLQKAETREQQIASQEQDNSFGALSSLQKKLKRRKSLEGYVLYLSPRELATLWHVPHRGFGDQPIVWAT